MRQLIILLRTGWVAELNFEGSLFNYLSAEIIIASNFLQKKEKPNKALQS